MSTPLPRTPAELRKVLENSSSGDLAGQGRRVLGPARTVTGDATVRTLADAPLAADH